MQVIKKIFCTNNKVSQVGEYWVMLITFISFDFPAGERGAKCIIALSVVPTCLTNVHSFYSLQVVQFPVTCIPTFLSTITGSGSSKSWKARLGFVDWFFFVLIVRLFGSGRTDKLPLVEFLETVGSLKFRGTSVLLRLPVSIIKLAQDEMYQSLTEDKGTLITR